MLRKFAHTASVASLIMALVGCNPGSGPSSEVEVSQSTGTGVFLDSPVSGLSYKIYSATGELQSFGKTNELGEFLYEVDGSDSYIEFFLGDLELGRAKLADTITPYNLMDISHHDDYAINVGRFLQTLDEDGNVENGIEISDITVRNFNSTYEAREPIDFDMDTESFAALVNPRLPEYSSRELVDSDAAREHLGESMAEKNDVVLDLNGTRWHGNTYKVVQYYLDDVVGWKYVKTCGDYPEGTGMYSIESYNKTDIDAEMSDEFDINTCTTTSSGGTFTYSYNKYSICPSRYCKYSDLNQVGPNEWDSEDQRYEQVTKRHVPGTDEIVMIKTITYTPGYGHGDISTKSVVYTLYKRI